MNTNNAQSNTKRILLHIPVGIATMVIGEWVSWAAACILFSGFIIYEVGQDRDIKDKSYKDILGALIGAYIAGIGLIIWNW